MDVIRRPFARALCAFAENGVAFDAESVRHVFSPIAGYTDSFGCVEVILRPEEGEPPRTLAYYAPGRGIQPHVCPTGGETLRVKKGRILVTARAREAGDQHARRIERMYDEGSVMHIDKNVWHSMHVPEECKEGCLLECITDKDRTTEWIDASGKIIAYDEIL